VKVKRSNRSRLRWKNVVVFAAIIVVGTVACSWVDYPVYQWFVSIDTGAEDWHRMFRVCGYLPVWLIVAAALALVDSTDMKLVGLGATLTRATLLLAPVLLTGALVEVLKIVIRRERPDMHAGLWVFRPFSDGLFHGGGLSTPSSHAGVAFAAAWCLCRLYPRASVVWIGLAVGCAVTRVMNHSHWVSDVFLSAMLSYAAVDLVWRWHERSQAKRYAAAAQAQAGDEDRRKGGGHAPVAH
jgi:membrane-associated phospholipid phosphatase